jgi:hypothetical protein
MHVLKKIFIGLGSLFLLLIALFAWLGIQSVRFRSQETPFVKAYVTDLSRRWNVADVYSRSANALINQANSAQGRRAIESFKALGALTAIHDFELQNYSAGTWGHRGVFDFKADFENGKALVQVIVVDKDGANPQVLAFHLESVEMSPGVRGRVST